MVAVMIAIAALRMQNENIISNNLLYSLHLCKKFLYFNKILSMNNIC